MRLPVVRNSWIWVCTDCLLQRWWYNGFSRKHGQSSSFILLYYYTLYLIKMMDLDLNFRLPKSWQDLDVLHLCAEAGFVSVHEHKFEVASVMQQGGRHGSHQRDSCAAVKSCVGRFWTLPEVGGHPYVKLSQTLWDPTKLGVCLEAEVKEKSNRCAKVATKARKQPWGQVLTTYKNTRFSIS